ncbi:hypothetical protein CU103_22165 [Phyllobacterium sophorae]|uniref:Uncharacterized protein n=1 Tax=Phyllobacterium sophorae TaxID=1520277 RepID=A0A2P7B4Z0_9HYPH|nr:hypothetical protein CU103_22165 [Phyllobacterium sophorae]
MDRAYRAIEALKSPGERLWSARNALEHGGAATFSRIRSKVVLIDDNAKHGPTSRGHCLPAPQSDLAQEAIKDP